MNNAMQTLIDSIKAEGFAVYGPEKLTTYVWFTDGTRIGYVQYNPCYGTSYTTVHKPNRETGTGFRADSLEEALFTAPHWAAQSARASVKKYPDFEHFRSQYWQPLVQY